MKLKLGELKPIMEALPVILEEKLPVKTAYWFTRTFRDLAREFKIFNETRMKLVDRYAKRDEKGKYIVKDGRYVMKDEKAFDREYDELAEQEIEIKFEPITIDQLGDINIKPMDLLKLGRLIKQENKDDKK